ncbi:hypothetical protein FHEFKHOI_01843 [Candidatus Methanoperedenaceae archaeon GB50]|nr:hypothetical protein AIOGIFDO_01836 [Candidatus Methanoperedenaceae archaeon GB37]CAD7775883.1 hypothetical protein FHEFKHOI_01843 [Candidatus Methanoperedenaceae archaeon GB50]CAD7781509.1 MAG: hypothetical protein KBONHNOK_01650 [Candidatus Methanoperedenaceae archaeon GB50]
MIELLERIIDDLYSIEGIDACILYRIDGTPILLRTPGFSEDILVVLAWLKKQICGVLKEMNKEGLSRAIFHFKDHKVLIAPSSKSTVLAAILSPGAHQMLTSIEIERITSEINRCVS